MACDYSRDGERFTATTDCPRCGAVGLHDLAEPLFEAGPPLPDNATPAERALRLINRSTDAMAIAAGGQSRYSRPGTEVVRICRSCGFRWGQR